LIDNDKSADVAVDPVDLMASVASLKPRPAPRLSEAFGYLSNDVIPEDNAYVETDEALQYVGVSSRPVSASFIFPLLPESFNSLPFSCKSLEFRLE
jgi:hypothetical protein